MWADVPDAPDAKQRRARHRRRLDTPGVVHGSSTTGGKPPTAIRASCLSSQEPDYRIVLFAYKRTPIVGFLLINARHRRDRRSRSRVTRPMARRARRVGGSMRVMIERRGESDSLGPHPIARRKLVVRTFDRAPSRYREKIQAKARAGAQAVTQASAQARAPSA